MSSDVLKAAEVAIGERLIEPWSGVVAVIEDLWMGPRKGTKPAKGDPLGTPALKADECGLRFGHPANCVVTFKKERLMRRITGAGTK